MTSGPESRSTKRAPRLGLIIAYLTTLVGLLYVSLFLLGNSRFLNDRLVELLAHALPGHMEFGEIRLGWTLNSVSIYDVIITDSANEAEPVIRADQVHTRADLVAALRGEITLTSTTVIRPRVLVEIDEKGRVGIERAFSSGDRHDPRRARGGSPPPVRLDNILLRDARVLVQVADGLTVLLDDLEVWNGSVSVIEGVPAVRAQASASRGHLILLPELLGLADPKQSTELRPYRALRRTDPWGAARREMVERLASGSDREQGALYLPMSRFSVGMFTLEGKRFAYGGVGMVIGGEELEVAGRMTVSDDKRDKLDFELRGGLSLSPATPLLAYFAGDEVVLTPDGGGGLDFDVAGSFGGIGGRVDLALAGLEVAGWRLDSVLGGIVSQPGGPFELSGQGLRIALADGSVVARGDFDPADGTYRLDLWLDGLDTFELVAPAVPDPDPSHFGGHLSTDPPRPGADERVGLAVRGDLDGKRLGAFSRARLELPRQSPPKDVFAVTIGGLTWERATRAVIPVEAFALTGMLRLSDDGYLRVGGRDGAQSLVLALDQDRVSASGAIDLLAQRFEGLRVSGSTRSIERLFGIDVEGRASVAVGVEGGFDDPRIRVSRLQVSSITANGLSLGQATTSAAVSLGGALPNVSGGHLELNDLSVGQDFSIARASADYSVTDGTLSIRHGDLDTRFGQIELDGRVGLTQGDTLVLDDPDLDLTVRGTGLDLAALAPDQPLAGSLGVDVRVGGSPSRPAVQGEVTASDVVAFGEYIDSASARIDYSLRGLSLSDIGVELAGGRASGRARLDSDGRLRSALLQLRDIDLARLALVDDLPFRLGGVTDITLEIIPPDEVSIPPGLETARPSPGLPDVQGSVIVRDLSLADTDRGAIAFTVDTYGDSVVALGQIAQVLDTRVRWPLEGDQPIVVDTRFDRVELGIATPGLSELIEHGEADGGILNAEIRLDDGLDLVSDLSIADLWLVLGGRRFEVARPIHVTYAIVPNGSDGGLSHQLNIDELSFGSEEQFLNMHGDIRDWEALNLSIDGELPMSLLRFFDEAVAEASGVATVALNLQGTLEDPLPVGEVGFIGASITPRGLNDAIALNSGRIVLTDPEVDEERGEPVQLLRIPDRYPLVGTVFGGAYELRGEVGLDRFQPYSTSLSLFATRPSYRIPGEASITFSQVDLNLWATDLDTEEESPFYLSGNLFIEEAVYFRDFGGDTGVTSTVTGLFRREVERYVDPIWRQIPELQQLQFDVTLFAEDNVYVRNVVAGADVDLELRLDLVLSGTILEPNLVGEVEVIDGEITFQNRTFVVQGCNVTFDGRTDSNGLPTPRVNACTAEATIMASRRNRDRGLSPGGLGDPFEEDTGPTAYVVRVIVDGQVPNQLDITLESVNANLDQRDILSLIFTGQTFDTLTAGAAAAGQPGLELVVGEFVNLLEGNLQELLSVDEFVVIPSVTGDGTIIQVSDRVSQRLTVDVGATVLSDEANQQNVRGQITLFDWLLLEVYGSSDDESNVEGGGRIRLRLEL